MSRKRILTAAAVAVAGLACYMLLRSGGNRLAPEKVTAGSAEVQLGLEAVRWLAEHPDAAEQVVSPAANPRARSAVERTADRLSELPPVKLESAHRTGEYLRLTVATPMGEGRMLRLHFFMKEEGGRMRITGVQR